MALCLRVGSALIAMLIAHVAGAAATDSPVAQPDHGAIPNFHPRAAYPFELYRTGVSGHAKVECDIDERGRVTAARLLTATHKEFGVSALERVKTWRFEPAMKAGMPVASTMEIEFPFRRTPSKPR